MKSFELVSTVVALACFGAVAGPLCLLFGFIAITLARYSLGSLPTEWGVPFFEVAARLLAELLYLSLFPICLFGVMIGALAGAGFGLVMIRQTAVDS